MNTEVVFFNAKDDIKLSGLLYKTSEQSNKVIISVHGMKNNCINPLSDTIAKISTDNNIDFLSFNTRGHDLVSYAEKYIDNKKVKQISGMAYEDVLESYYDIKGAILYALSIGYTDIFLLGHSLGCTKIVYSYNKLLKEEDFSILNKIKAILLLSLVDIPNIQKFYLGDKYDAILKYAEEQEKQNKEYELMPLNSFIHPISVKTYLRYFKYNEEIDFARYSDKDYSFKELNNIKCPLFMRWGTNKEMILQSNEELINLLGSKIQNKYLDINYIPDATHSYINKEAILGKQIMDFIMKI